MKYAKILGTAGVLAMTAIVAGCASNQVTPQQQSLVRAEASIQKAEKSGAYEHGSAELDLARKKLERARRAAEDGEEERAGRLATEAELNAELAAAIASNQEMQAAADEQENSLETLRMELRKDNKTR